MQRFLAYSGWLALFCYNTLGGVIHFRVTVMRPLALALFLGLTPLIFYRRGQGRASDLELSLPLYFFLATLGFWLSPDALGRVMTVYAVTVIYLLLFRMAAVPPLLGAAPFTTYFARQTAPAAAWDTPLFKEINRHLTGFWAGLFALCALVSLAPQLWPGLGRPWLFSLVFPLALLGVGFRVNRWYPARRRRQLGLAPGPAAPEESNPCLPKTAAFTKEKSEMSATPKVVAINGSPHEGFGNTSQMLAMLQEPLAREGFDLEEVFLSRHHIEYCAGCGLCIEKGACWIRDDHRAIVHKLLEADAVILASPVYFRNVTGQMKTFLDRSLGYGHRPRGTWKPGLAVSVSAGWGETMVVQYLGQSLRVYGAFALGHLTAMATHPGGFIGRELVAARAADLARDLARAVREGRRFPASDQDLDFWHFIGGLVQENREFMKADYEHWQKLGILESFEAYVGQKRSQPPRNEEMRQAWLQELRQRQKDRSAAAAQPPADPAPRGQTAREMIEMMPEGFNPDAAAGLTVTYQFEVSGSENFTAHLRIANQQAVFHEGPAAQPEVTISTPADVWLAICRGEFDGAQAFMTGKFKVAGDLGLLMKLNAIFPRKPS